MVQQDWKGFKSKTTCGRRLLWISESLLSGHKPLFVQLKRNARGCHKMPEYPRKWLRLLRWKFVCMSKINLLIISQYCIIHIWRRILLLHFCFLLHFWKKFPEKEENEQTKVYDHVVTSTHVVKHNFWVSKLTRLQFKQVCSPFLGHSVLSFLSNTK